MFNDPIRHTELTSLEEVLKFSFRTNDFFGKGKQETYWQKDDQIAFVDSNGWMWVTPYRSEIVTILRRNEYKEERLQVPFSKGEERPGEYLWLVKIAEEENWARTYEAAQRWAELKGIKKGEIDKNTKNLRVREVNPYIEEPKRKRVFWNMTSLFLTNETEKNVGTYIIVDNRTLVICDEYGRTFLVEAAVINDIVNLLLDLNYTRTLHPERYVIEEPFEESMPQPENQN